ncbi:MAG TPA: hypothetical protein GXZ50_08645 [Clostridia bacterium]|nr:hypothetical protein [Clostridia bacterium]
MLSRLKNEILRFSFATLIIFLILFSSETLAYADYQPSPWALTKLEIARSSGLTPKDFDHQQFTASITRRDFCELLINSCSLFGYPLPKVPKSHPFTDTQDKVVEQAFILGLTSGTAKGIFSPDLPLTREMAVVMLGKLHTLLEPNYDLMDEQQAGQILQKYANDSAKISDWAKRYMADAYSRGIIAGTGNGVLDPKGNLTREQGVILTLNLLAYCDSVLFRELGIKECILPAPSGMYISPYYTKEDVNLTWSKVPSATEYEVRIYSNGTLAYAARTKDNSLDLRTSSPNVSVKPEDIFGKDRQPVRAALEVIPLDKKGTPSVFTLKQEFTVLASDSQRRGSTVDRSKIRFSSEAEALAYMEDIEVQVWRIVNGTKKTATITLKVHQAVADDVKKIFEEIYNGKEQFPIKSCVGFSWRGETSQHNLGLAIDINPEENYFIGRNGTIKAGKLWKPGENPYSIIPGGDVVRAFNKYGWHWSPDMNWSNGADYMHFSLSGT